MAGSMVSKKPSAVSMASMIPAKHGVQRKWRQGRTIMDGVGEPGSMGGSSSQSMHRGEGRWRRLGAAMVAWGVGGAVCGWSGGEGGGSLAWGGRLARRGEEKGMVGGKG